MAAAKKSAPKASVKKVHDIAKPGTTPAGATSRPIIVNNRPLLQDPMVVAAAPGAGAAPELAPAEPAPAAPSASRITIKPIIADSGETEEAPQAAAKEAPAAPEAGAETKPPAPRTETAETPEEPVEEAAEETGAEEPANEPAEPAVPPAEPAEPADGAVQPAAQPEMPAGDAPEEADDKATPEGDVPSSAQTPEQIEAAAREAEEQAAAHAAAIDKLAESKQYYLPIKTEEQRHAKRFIALGAVLIVVLALAWLDVALDAGLIHTSSVKPVTHFFTH
jgi:hypothetical protein